MKHVLALALALGCVTLVGCGSGSPSRSYFEGKVTYEGQPVVYGMVMFNPDRARGNKGVFGVAEINDGVYQTNPGYGPTSGPMLVTFQVFDARPPSNNMVANIIDVPVDFSRAASRDFHLKASDIKPITN